MSNVAPTDGSFDHELKMRRAFKHVMDLNAQVKSWIGGDHHTVRYEYDFETRWTGPIPPGPALDQGGYYLAGSVFIPGQGPGTAPAGVGFGEGVVTAHATAEDPPRDPIGLLIGDVLHNLRSALDNLAYTLASTFTEPLPQELADSSEFPIFGDEDRQGNSGVGSSKFHERKKNGDPAARSGLHKIRGWHPDAQAVVEGLQPYHRGKDFRSDPLWIVHELNRIDKHRLLNPVIAVFAGTLWDIGGFKNVRCIGPGLIESLGGTIETETPISRIWGVHLIDPDAEVHMEIKPSLDVAFAPKTSVEGGEPVVRTLTDMYLYIGGTVIPALAPFLS